LSKRDCLAALYVFLIILLSSLSYASILINEIMYNPTGTDSKHEWIEIYSNESNSNTNNLTSVINISGYKLFENNVKHSLTLINDSFLVSDFAVIADDASTFLKDYPDFNGTLFDSVFSLSNTEETIAILDNTDIVIDNITYNDSLGADNNGRTLVRANNSNFFVQNIFVEGTVIKGTPGRQNIGIQETIIQDLALEAYIADSINLNIEQTKLFRIVNKNPDSGKIYTTIVKYNITKQGITLKEEVFIKDEIIRYSSSNTGTFTPTSTGEYLVCGSNINSSILNEADLSNNFACKNFTVIDTSNVPCNISLNLFAEKTLYQNEEKIKYDIILSDETYPFTISYSVFGLLGDEIKRSQNTTNTNTKTFTPEIDEADRILLIKAELVSLVCSDNNLSDNLAEIIILVNGTTLTAEKGKRKGSGNESNLSIIDVSPDNIKFGQLIKARLNLYKGDTAKTAISAYVIDDFKAKTKISRTTSSLNLHDKNTFYEITIPILLKDNCDDDFEDGSYQLIIEGLGVSAKKSINIAGITGNVCDNSVAKLKLDETRNLDNADESAEEVNTFSTSSRKKVEYKLIDYPKTAVAGEKITSKVKIINNDNIAHDFSVYNYIALGRRSISGKIKANMKNITVNARESKELELINLLNDNIASGEYKLRVNFKKDSIKTINSIIETLILEEKDVGSLSEEEGTEEEQDESELLSKEDAQSQLTSDTKKTTLETSSTKITLDNELDDIDEITLTDEDLSDEYVSTSIRAKRLLPNIIIITLILIVVAIIIKKE